MYLNFVFIVSFSIVLILTIHNILALVEFLDIVFESQNI